MSINERIAQINNSKINNVLKRIQKYNINRLHNPPLTKMEMDFSSTEAPHQKNFLKKKVVPVLKKALPVAERILPVAATFVPALAPAATVVGAVSSLRK